MAVELSIKVSNPEQSYIQKWLHMPDQGALAMSKTDTQLQSYVEEAVKNFKGNVDDIDIKMKMNGW